MSESNLEALRRASGNARAALTDAAVEGAAKAEQPLRPHVNRGPSSNEWRTPKVIVEAAREVLGHIDLDPASSPGANETVRASRIFTAEENGLENIWFGRVWMNPPYSKGLMGPFCQRLREQVQNGNVKQAIVITNNSTETGWFTDLRLVSSALCFTHNRVQFERPDGETGKTPAQAQTIFYSGLNVAAFVDAFERRHKIGWVVRL